MSDKAGGPYTKPEQEKRRKLVYQMHFEKSISAIKIAEELDVNRHTITDDIKYWYSELASEFDALDVRDLFLKQYSRMENQRDRLLQLLERQQEVPTILKIERMIFELDCAITKMILPILEHKKEISQEEAVDVVQHLTLDDEHEYITGYSDNQLLRDIAKYKNCDILRAQKILDVIKDLGLELYKDDNRIFDVTKYDLLGFVESRNLLPAEKLQEVYAKMEKKEQEHREEIESLVRLEKETMEKFLAKYGPKETWSADVWSEFNAKSSGFDSIP